MDITQFGFISSSGQYYRCTSEQHARQMAGLVPQAQLVREQQYTRPTTPRDPEYDLAEHKTAVNLVNI